MGKVKNILLLFLSNYKDKVEEANYYYDDKNYIVGKQTNDAPVKYLLKVASEDGCVIDTILCITTKEVKGDSDSNSAFEMFKKMVKNYCNNYEGIEKLKEPNIISIDYQNDEKNGIKSIYEQIVVELGNSPDEKNIYIDYTGGFRDVSFFMTSIIRYFEFNNVKCKKIIYSKFINKNDKNAKNEIIDMQYIYDMFQMINGVSEFVMTGNAQLLSNFFDKEIKENSLEGKLLKAMIRFSNIISLCNLKELDQTMIELSEAIDNLEKIESKENVELKDSMLKSLIPLIKTKFYIDDKNHDDKNHDDKNHKNLTYRQIIQWCLDNSLLQQAITIYIEKMPICYDHIRGFIPDCVKEPKKSAHTAHIQNDKFYTSLFNLYIYGKEYTEFENIFKEMNKDVDIIKELESVNVDNDIRGRVEFFIIDEKDIKDRIEKGEIKDNKDKYTIIPPKIKYVLPGVDYEKDDKFSNQFIQKMKDDSKNIKLKHYFVYNNVEKYDKIKEQKSTYKKKLFAIDNLEKEIKELEKEIKELEKETLTDIENKKLNNKKELLLAMKCYFAMKVYRNQMNHASEKDNSEEEEEAMQKINDYFEFTSQNSYYEKAKKILQTALNQDILKDCSTNNE